MEGLGTKCRNSRNYIVTNLSLTLTYDDVSASQALAALPYRLGAGNSCVVGLV